MSDVVRESMCGAEMEPAPDRDVWVCTLCGACLTGVEVALYGKAAPHPKVEQGGGER